MPLISVHSLSKTFELTKKSEGFKASLKSLFKREKTYKHAVKEVSFTIEEGEFVGFLGPNGAGKTTTLKMLSGILYPTKGEVSVLGYTPWQRKNAYKMQIAMVMGQKSQLWWDLPAIETFRLNQDIYEIPEEKFQENLKYLSETLEADHILDIPVRKLSLGQRMKCELIAALLHDPKVIFLDEPTIGLDVNSQRNMRDFLKKYNQEKKATIILTSHYMEDIKQLCPRVIIINEGEKIYDGSYGDLVKEYVQEKLIELTFEGEIPKKEIEESGYVKSWSEAGVILSVPREKTSEVLSTFVGKFQLADISVKEMDASEVVADIFSNAKKHEKI